MNIAYEIYEQQFHEHSVRNIRVDETSHSERNIKAVLPEIEHTKCKGSTAMNIANKILGQLRKE